MVTDNWPVDFRYISSRLVSEIVQQAEAARTNRRLSASLNIQLLSLAVSKRDLDYRNKFLLCQEAAAAVADHTGSLEFPGAYVRQEIELEMGFLTVLMGWKKKTHVTIASLLGTVPVDGVGQVLVALFGSDANYTWKRPKENDLSEIPSDVDGLYGLLDATREASDPEIEDHFLDRDPGHDDKSRVDLVVGILRDRYKGYKKVRLDVLAKVFYCVDEFSLGEDHYDRVIIGSPVWAATPMPRALS